jgi:hypothetical protein
LKMQGNLASAPKWLEIVMRSVLYPAALLAALLPLSPAAAGMPVTKTMTCPIGGASFEFTTTASYSTFGTRPDGKPYGSWTFPTALPECPSNGLVLYKEYTAAEVARLEPLVASEAYQALRHGDTQYYRAYWLMKEMGLGPEDYLWALLQATWEADDKPALRARYQAELVDASAKVPPNSDDLNWFGMEARAVNALRELGRFDEALVRLDKLPLATLDVAEPAGLAGDPPSQQAKQRRAWLAYFKKLRAVIERHDPASEPFDLIPLNVVVGRCVDQAEKLSEQQRAYCATGEAKAGVERMLAARSQLQQEEEALKRSREESGR